MQTVPTYQAEAELRRLPHETLRQLARRGRLVRHKANSQVLTQGQIGHELYIVLDGRLEAYIHTIGRKERRLTVATLRPGDIFGEMAIDGEPRSASVCCVQASLCAMISREEFLQYREEDRRLSDFLTHNGNRRNRVNLHLMARTLFSDIYSRMIDLLIELGEPQTPTTFLINERLTHQEVAHRLGCSREMVSRLLKDLEKGEYITRRKDHTILVRTPLPMAW